MYKFYFEHIKDRLPDRVHGLLYRLAVARTRARRERLRKLILSYYKNHGENHGPQDEALEFLRTNPLCLIPYPWTRKYFEMPVKVYRENGLRYVLTADENKLYFKRDMDDYAVKKMFRELSMEQDPRSPHLYAKRAGDTVVDLGAAEGFFALSVAKEAGHLYLFESDPQWIEPLEATFRDFADKVTIVNKFVSDSDDGRSVSLDTYFRDTYFRDRRISLLKADLEGAEPGMLRGAAGLLSGGRIDMASVCTYHHPGHASEFTRIFESYGYSVRAVPGLMPHWEPPHLLTGMIWAEKDKQEDKQEDKL